MLPNLKLTLTQWKMIVNVAKYDLGEGLIDIDLFFKMCETTAKNLKSHPRIIKAKKNESFDINPMTTNPNGVGFKTTTNGFYYNRRSNSINRESKNLNLIDNKGIKNNYYNQFGATSNRNYSNSNRLVAFG